MYVDGTGEGGIHKCVDVTCMRKKCFPSPLYTAVRIEAVLRLAASCFEGRGGGELAVPVTYRRGVHVPGTPLTGKKGRVVGEIMPKNVSGVGGGGSVLGKSIHTQAVTTIPEGCMGMFALLVFAVDYQCLLY